MERPDNLASLSPVATLCLAILHHGEATGYEIKKASTEGDFSYFVDASFGSIYPALARLASDGHVTQREEVQSGRSRKVYALTERGRDALLAALAEPPGDDVFRSPFLLLAKFAPHLARERIEAALAERRRSLVDELAHLDELAKTHDDAASRWIIDYGKVCLGASLAYLEANAPALAALAEAQKLAAE